MRNARASLRACPIAVLVVLMLGSACKSEESTNRSPAQPTVAPATQASARVDASTGSTVYENKSAGLRLQYPSDWKPVQNGEYVLCIEPASAGSNPNDAP